MNEFEKSYRTYRGYLEDIKKESPPKKYGIMLINKKKKRKVFI